MLNPSALFCSKALLLTRLPLCFLTLETVFVAALIIVMDEAKEIKTRIFTPSHRSLLFGIFSEQVCSPISRGKFLYSKFCYPISTLPEHLHSTILRTPKLPENTHKPMETSFHPPLTLVPLLANYPHSHYSPPSLGIPPTHTPF